MKRHVLAAIGTVMLVLILFWILAPTAALAEEATVGEVTQIERVRWSGLSLSGWRIFGSWAEAPIEPSLFGAASPYFRLNGDDKAVFRGLGRESNFVQRIFPTLHSRTRLRNVMGADEVAARSLVKFDSQVAKGEKIHMVSTATVFTGKTAIVVGIVMMFAGLSEGVDLSGETSGMTETGLNVAIAGTSLWFVGRIGRLAGTVLTKQSFAHLNDAMRHYN